MITAIWSIYAFLNILLQWRISKAFNKGFVEENREKLFNHVKDKLGHLPSWDDEEIMKKCEDPSYLRWTISVYANMWMLPVALLVSCLVIWFS